MTLDETDFQYTVEKGDNAGNQHCLLFPKCFLPFPKQVLIFYFKFILLSANAFNLDQSRILSFGKGLICHYALPHQQFDYLTAIKKSHFCLMHAVNCFQSINCEVNASIISLCGRQCRSKIRLYRMCSLILMYTVP